MISPVALSLFNRAYYSLNPLPVAQVGICRIRWDHECFRVRGGGQYSYLERFYTNKSKKNRGLPAPVNYYGGSGGVRLLQVWQDFFYAHNTPAAIAYTKGKGKTPDTGWVNKQPWPVVRQVSWAGLSYVVVDKIIGDKAYIQTYDNSKHPHDYAIDYLQQFSVTYQFGNTSLPDCGRCYTFPIANKGENLWMYTDDLTFVRAA